MTATLWEFLRSHAARHQSDARLHLPAHRGGAGVPELVEAFGSLYVQQDLTEVAEIDDSVEPSGVLRTAAEAVAKTYGAKHAFLLAQGSSQGLASAIYAAAAPAGIVLLPQNCHRSALQGLVMAGARPVFYPVQWDSRFGVFTRPDLERVEQLARTTGAAAVVFVYPSYEGVAFDVAEAVARVHRAGAVAIVDAAHGSHFGRGGLPPHPAAAKADFTVLGLHKSGGALTPGALLLVEQEDTGRVVEALRLFGTSSPSYPILASVALAVATLELHGDERVRASVAAAALLRGPAVYEPEGAHDPTRKLIRCDAAAPLADKLHRRFGILPEYVTAKHLLFLFGLGFPEEKVRAWARAIDDLPPPEEPIAAPPLGEGVLTPRDALLVRREKVPLPEAAGRVAAGVLAPSPPGIPLVWPGQRITRWVVEQVEQALTGGQTVIGLRSGAVEVVA
jgi:arginine decarboxylase